MSPSYELDRHAVTGTIGPVTGPSWLAWKNRNRDE